MNPGLSGKNAAKPGFLPLLGQGFGLKLTGFNDGLGSGRGYCAYLGLVSLVFPLPCFPGNPALLFSVKFQYGGKLIELSIT